MVRKILKDNKETSDNSQNQWQMQTSQMNFHISQIYLPNLDFRGISPE